MFEGPVQIRHALMPEYGAIFSSFLHSLLARCKYDLYGYPETPTQFRAWKMFGGLGFSQVVQDVGTG